MKCPKCGYLGFEHVERCRNCGYDFLLSRTTEMPEWSIEPVAEPNPIGDLEMVDRAARVDTDTFALEMDRGLDRVLNQSEPLRLAEIAAPVFAPVPIAAPAPQPIAAPGPAAALPFSLSSNDDAPMITRPSPPRQPLAVRRATPEVPRLRAEARSSSLDLPLEPNRPEPSRMADRHPAHAAATVTNTGDRHHAPAPDGEAASVGARLTAVAVDLFILATIDAAVIYFTMQICAVSLSELAVVPKVPLIAFLLVQNGGYLVAFTAGGQTLGKMAAGIKVVTSESDASLDVGRALLRTLLWVVLAIPAGLGFLTAFVGHDHRALHDRFAGTRVVRASA